MRPAPPTKAAPAPASAATTTAATTAITPQPQLADTVRFKCRYDSVHRNLYLPKPVTYARLLEQVRKLFAQPLEIIYLTEDRRWIEIKTQAELDRAIKLSRSDPHNLVKLILTEPSDEGALSESASTTSSLRRPSMSGDDVFAHHQTEEAEIRKRSNSRHSPPPGFLVTDRARSGSSASSRAFHDVNGGGEFIPECSAAAMSLPQASPPYPHLTDGTLTVRSNASSLSGYTDDANVRTPLSRDFFPDRGDSESGIDVATVVRGADFDRLDMRSTVPRTFADSAGVRKRQFDGPQTLPREATRTTPFKGPSDATISRQLRNLDLRSSGSVRRESESETSTSTSEILKRLNQARAPAAVSQHKPKRWKKGNRLGSGAFGQVFVAYNEDTSEEVAMKQVDLHPEGGRDSLKEVQSLEAEIQLLRDVSHERIVQYYGTERTPEYLCIFMEYVAGGSVANRLRVYGPFSMSTVRKYTRQILEGLAYLHDNNIVHRDIKGANVLVTTGGDIKLADFGASKRLQAMRTLTGFKSVHGTPFWMAPEVIDGKGYGRRSDVWSVGCTVIEMMKTVPPNHDSEPMAALFKIGSPTHDFCAHIPLEAPEDCRRFLTLCFRRDKSARPHTYELLRHEFVAEKPGASS